MPSDALLITLHSSMPENDSVPVFHRYWNFRINRTWAKKRQQEAGGMEETEYVPPPLSVGARTTSEIQSQLAGLRHRAAVRSNSQRPSQPRRRYTVDMDDHGWEQHIWEQHEWECEEACKQDAPSATAATVPEQLYHDSMESPAAESSPTKVPDTGAPVEQPHPPKHHPGSRRKFVAHSGTRDQVVGQLAGLRRKASMSRV